MRRVAPVLAVGLLLLAPAAAGAAPPDNDDRADAQRLQLPANVMGTTVEATVEPDEPFVACTANAAASVWYTVTAASADRISLQLSAAGDLDASLDIFRRTRSQLTRIGCEATDEEGEAEQSFRPEKDGIYLIRVSQRQGSVAGNFRLQVFAPQPQARAPGPRLPRRGADGAVDRVQNLDDAFSFFMREGRSYRINLASDGCVSLSIYPPGTRDFDGDSPVRRLRCGGYTLFTPGPGEGGRYSLRAEAGGRGVLRYHLQAARAGADDTSPGDFVGNYARIRGALRGSGVDVVDLYRFDVVRRSNLRLDLSTGGDFDLILTNDRGRRLGCGCGESGSTFIEERVRSGRYFVAVRSRGGSTARYTLRRVSRAITSTGISINGERSATGRPGAAARIGVRVRPAVSGSVTIVIERFDPLEGWQFFRRVRTRVGAGSGGASFVPPAVGRYRARASFNGSRSAARSSTGFVYLLVAGPLRS